jgi:hypothetical protein
MWKIVYKILIYFSNISYDVLSYLKNKSLKFQLISEETKKENLYLFHFSTYTMKGSLAKWRVRDVDETKVSIPITRVLTSIVSTLLSIPHTGHKACIDFCHVAQAWVTAPHVTEADGCTTISSHGLYNAPPDTMPSGCVLASCARTTPSWGRRWLGQHIHSHRINSRAR